VAVAVDQRVLAPSRELAFGTLVESQLAPVQTPAVAAAVAVAGTVVESATAFGSVAALAVELVLVAAPTVGLLTGPVVAAAEVLEFSPTRL
jgi:hypothetical protein